MTVGTDKKEKVERMFDAIAPTYDGLNHLLSLGVDMWWRRKVVSMAVGGRVGSEVPRRVLDVATGTGDLAIALARRMPQARVTGIDISERMLAEGRKKILGGGFGGRVELREGDGEALDFSDGEFDRVTVAFGVRNFGDIAAGLGEMRRVLRRGGKCFVLEFSKPRGSLFAWVYDAYFHTVLPWLGRVVSKDGAAYSYLPDSVDGFPAPEEFAGMLRGAGFSSVKIKRLTFGVACIYEAEK